MPHLDHAGCSHGALQQLRGQAGHDLRAMTQAKGFSGGGTPASGLPLHHHHVCQPSLLLPAPLDAAGHAVERHLGILLLNGRQVKVARDHATQELGRGLACGGGVRG